MDFCNDANMQLGSRIGTPESADFNLFLTISSDLHESQMCYLQHTVNIIGFNIKIQIVFVLFLVTERHLTTSRRHHSRNGNAWVLFTHGIVWMWHRCTKPQFFKLHSLPQDPTKVRFAVCGEINVSFRVGVYLQIDAAAYLSFNDAYVMMQVAADGSRWNKFKYFCAWS